MVSAMAEKYQPALISPLGLVSDEFSKLQVFRLIFSMLYLS